MIRTTFGLIATALIATAGTGQTTVASDKKVTSTTKTTMPVATDTKTATATHSKTTRTTAADGHMVTTKTSTGKTITYDCSKPGNKNKAACKK